MHVGLGGGYAVLRCWVGILSYGGAVGFLEAISCDASFLFEHRFFTHANREWGVSGLVCSVTQIRRNIGYPPPPRRGGGLFSVAEKTRILVQLLVLRVLEKPPRNRVYH